MNSRTETTRASQRRTSATPAGPEASLNAAVIGHLAALGTTYAGASDIEKSLLLALLERERGQTASPRPFLTYTRSDITTPLHRRLDSLIQTLDQALEPADWSIDYLFEDPLPESVPSGWVAELRAARITEDSEFSLPWIDDADDT